MVKRKKLLKKIRRLHYGVKSGRYENGFTCHECGSPHPCQTYRLADGFMLW